MIKFKQGYIRNMNGETKNIEVKALLPNRAKDILVGSSLITAGVIYLTVTAFKHGSEAFESAEYRTMVDLGIIKD